MPPLILIFSQVEADSPQLDINNTFSLFFPERRTFSLDGADYFDTFQNLVHIRNIADPRYGAKLTGKSGDHSYGFLTAIDASTSFLIPRSLGFRVASLADLESELAIAHSSPSSVMPGYPDIITDLNTALRQSDANLNFRSMVKLIHRHAFVSFSTACRYQNSIRNCTMCLFSISQLSEQ